MRRYLIAALLVVVLAVVAFSQRINANPQGGLQNYSPLVYGAAPTPTTAPTVTPTVTGTPVGTGYYKKDGSTIYHGEDREYIGTCGFIHFYDGITPAYGGPEGYRTISCMDNLGYCVESYGLDATGYYETPIISFTDMPDNGGGSIYVIFGEDDEVVSQSYRWDFGDVREDAAGVVIRMDFKECRADDTSDRCERPADEINKPIIAAEDLGEMVPTNFCPEVSDPTPTPD